MTVSSRYRVSIRVEGELAAGWSATLAGLTVAPQPEGTTLISGELTDQAAIHGLLAVVRDLGLSLVSVETVAIHPSASRSGG